MARTGPAKEAEARLREIALGYPEAHEDLPWGERVVKVRKKVFVFLGRGEDGGLHLSVKLPQSAGLALMLPFAEPTGYNLGASGWVSATFGPDEEPPVEMLAAWIDESYRAVAPKRLSALLPPRSPGLDAPAAARPRGSSRRRRRKAPGG